MNRFETLSLEAQLHLDCNKEFPFPTSKQSPNQSDHLLSASGISAAGKGLRYVGLICINSLKLSNPSVQRRII